jgi:8-oxo-dGTP diphosphatase
MLVQRANPPDKGLWSIPGGKIELGETTLQAAQREIYEETKLRASSSLTLNWHLDPFMTTDVIFKDDDDGADMPCAYAFHYVIAHCFGRIELQNDRPNHIPSLRPSDDALDAKWWTLEEVLQLDDSKILSTGVVTVLKRAEELSQVGAFHVSYQQMSK